ADRSEKNLAVHVHGFEARTKEAFEDCVVCNCTICGKTDVRIERRREESRLGIETLSLDEAAGALKLCPQHLALDFSRYLRRVVDLGAQKPNELPPLVKELEHPALPRRGGRQKLVERAILVGDLGRCLQHFVEYGGRDERR